MKKNRLLKKGLVCGTILLFVGASIIPSMGRTVEEEQNSTDRKTSFMGFNSRGDTLYVGGSGPGNYTRIQDAIDNASNGDTVFVYDDSSPYYENVIVNKSINLIGEDRDTTVVDGGGSGDVIHVTADWVNTSGFNIRNGSSGFYLNNSSNNTLNNNIVNSNAEFGINLKFCSNNSLISYCVVTDNVFGIVIWNSSNNQLKNCYVCNNTLGITLLNSSSNIIVNNIANNNTYVYEGPPPPPGPPSAGILFAQSTQSTLINNSFSNNTVGILFFNLFNESKRKSYFNNSIDTSNRVNGRPVYYFFDRKDLILDSLETSHLSLAFCDSCVIKNCNISNGDGIFLWSSSNNTITYSTSSNNYCGILLYSSKLYRSFDNIISNCEVYYNSFNGVGLQGGSSRNTLSNCNIYSNGLSPFGVGVSVGDSSNNNIINNTFTNDGMLIGGDIQKHFTQNISGNTVNGKPLYYFLNQENMDIDGQAVGQLILINCTNFLINNTDISHTAIGIEIQFSSNISISNCNIYNISFCAIGTGYGSNHMSISDCNIYNSSVAGIAIGDSSNNSISNCNVYSNYWFGISLTRSADNNLISNCNISNSSGIGLFLIDSSYNTIYHNNFIGNTQNANDNGENTWDDGEYGNYWDDYEERYPNAHKKWWKGIWDTPYEIPGGDSKDRYPLIKQWPNSSPISMPKYKAFNFNFNLLSWLFEQFPNAFPILRNLLGL